MSTRGTICVKLRDEDIGRSLFMKDEDGNDTKVAVMTDKDHPYMCVYCHHDSYIEMPGLGYELPRNITTYEEARDYILQGDRTSFETPYAGKEYGEDPEDVQPAFMKSITGSIPEEYLYVFEDGVWKVRPYSSSTFRTLAGYCKRVTLEEKEMEAVKWVIQKYEKIWNVTHDIPEHHHMAAMKQAWGVLRKINTALGDGKKCEPEVNVPRPQGMSDNQYEAMRKMINEEAKRNDAKPEEVTS